MEFLPMEYDGQNGPAGARRQQVLMPVHSITGASYTIDAGASSSIPAPSYAIATAPAYAIAGPSYCQPYRFAAPSYAIPNGSYITGASYAVAGPSCQVSTGAPPPLPQAIPGPNVPYSGMGNHNMAPIIPGTFAMGGPGITGPYSETGGSYATIGGHSAPFSTIGDHPVPYSTIGDHSVPYSTIGDHSVSYSSIAYTHPVSSLSYHTAPSSTMSGSYSAATVSLSHSRHTMSGPYPGAMSVPYSTPIVSAIPNAYNISPPRAIQRFYAPTTEGQPGIIPQHSEGHMGIMPQHYSTASHSPIIMSQPYQGPVVVPPIVSPVTTMNGSYIAYANPLEPHSIPNIGNQTFPMCNATDGISDCTSKAMESTHAEITAVHSQKIAFGIKHESSLPNASTTIADHNITNSGHPATIPGPSPQLETSSKVPFQGTCSDISKDSSSLVQIHSSTVARPRTAQVFISKTVLVPVVFEHIPTPEHFLLPENQGRPFQIKSGIDIGNLFKLLNALQNRIGFAIAQHRFLSDPSTYPEPHDDGGYKPLTVQAAFRDLRSLSRQQRGLMEKLRRWNCLKDGVCYDWIVKRIYTDICKNCQGFADFKERNKSVNKALRDNKKQFEVLGSYLPFETEGASAPLNRVHPHSANNPPARTRNKIEHAKAEPAHPESSMTQESFLAELGLVTLEVCAQRKADSGKVRTERRRRTTANPKYKSKVEEPTETGRCTRSRRSDPESLKTPEPSSSHVGRQSIAVKPNSCGACGKLGVRVVCKKCLSKYHGQCIRVSGSKAFAPPVVDCCPNCVPSHPHVSASDFILASRRRSRPFILRTSNARCVRKTTKRKQTLSKRRVNSKKPSTPKKSPIRRKHAPRKKETSENINPKEEVKMITRSRKLPPKQTLNHSLAVAAAAAVPSLFKPSQDVSNEDTLADETLVPSYPKNKKIVAKAGVKWNSKQIKKTTCLPKKNVTTPSNIKTQFEILARHRGTKISSLNIELPAKQDAEATPPVDLKITQKRNDNHKSIIAKKIKKKVKSKGIKRTKKIVRDLDEVKTGKADRKERGRKENALLKGPLEHLHMKKTMQAFSVAAGIVMSSARTYADQEEITSISIKKALQKSEKDTAEAGGSAKLAVATNESTNQISHANILAVQSSSLEEPFRQSTTALGTIPKTKPILSVKPKIKIDPGSKAISKSTIPIKGEKLSQTKPLPTDPVLNDNSKAINDMNLSSSTNSAAKQTCSPTQIQKPQKTVKGTIRTVTAKVIIPDVPPSRDRSDLPLTIARKSLPPPVNDNKIVVPVLPMVRKESFTPTVTGAPPIKPRKITSLGRKSSISTLIQRSASQINIQRSASQINIQRVTHPVLLNIRPPALAVPKTSQTSQERKYSEPEQSTSKIPPTQPPAKSMPPNTSNGRKSFRKKALSTPEAIHNTISRVIAATESDADFQRLIGNNYDAKLNCNDSSEHSIQYPSTSRALQSVDNSKQYPSGTQDPPHSTGNFSGGYTGGSFPKRVGRSPSPSSDISSLGSSRSVQEDDSSSDELLSIPGTTPYFGISPRVKTPAYLELEALNRLDLQDFKGVEYLPPASTSPKPGPSNKKGKGPGGKGKGKKS